MSVASGRAGLAVVRDLNARPVADIATEELREAIFRGEYLPGAIIALRDLAERTGCRLSALLACVRRLEDDALIVVRHDVAMVRPLDADELRSAWRLARMVQSVINERVVAQFSDADLDRIRAFYPTASVDSATFYRELADASFRCNQFIMNKAATRVDHLVVRPIVQTLKRHYGPLATGPALPLELLHTRADAQRAIGIQYRTRRIRAVLESNERSWEASEAIGHLLIERFTDPEAKREHARILQFRR